MIDLRRTRQPIVPGRERVLFLYYAPSNTTEPRENFEIPRERKIPLTYPIVTIRQNKNHVTAATRTEIYGIPSPSP